MEKAKMASLFSTAFFFILAVTNSTAVASKEFKVGDSEGWRNPGANDTAFYGSWAARNRLVVGDSLLFEYRNDSVLVVDKFGYYHCNSSKPISVFNDGKTVIKLDKPGAHYFVSGDPDHCKNGQRLAVDVMSLHPPIRRSPPSGAAPPQPYLMEAPAPAPNSGGSVPVTVSTVAMAVIVTMVVVGSCAP